MIDFMLMAFKYGVYAIICLSVVFVFVVYLFGVILMTVELIRTEVVGGNKKKWTR